MKLFKYKEYNNNNNTSNITYKYLILSLFSVVICASLLCLTSYAWFTSTTSTSVSSSRFLTYNLSYILDDSDIEISISNDVDGTSTETIESATNQVKIILIASETSSKTGYCVIKVGDDTYYTNQIEAGSSYSFTLSNVNNKIITFYPHWGEPPSTIALTLIEGTKIQNNELTLSTTSLNSSDEDDAKIVVDEQEIGNDVVLEDKKTDEATTTNSNSSDESANDSTVNDFDESNVDISSGTSTSGVTESDKETSGDSVDTDPQEETTNIKSIENNESEESKQSNELDVSMDTSGNAE